MCRSYLVYYIVKGDSMDEIAKWFNYKRLAVGVEKERHSDMCAKQHTCYCAIDVERQWHSEIRLFAVFLIRIAPY